MNRLNYLTYGGNAVEAEDFEWLQNATRDAVKEFIKGFGINNIDSLIIYGCEVTGGNYSAGAVVLAGEILPVQAGVLPTLNPGEAYQFQVMETPDPSGTEPLESGGTTNQYRIREAVVVSAAPGTSLALDGKRLQDEEDWVDLTPINGASSSAAYSGAIPHISVRRTKRKTLQFRGYVNVPETLLSTVLPFTILPVGYRPSKLIRVSAPFRDIHAASGMLDKITILQINGASSGFVQNGEIMASTTAGVAATVGWDSVIYLDGIEVPLD